MREIKYIASCYLYVLDCEDEWIGIFIDLTPEGKISAGG